MPRKPSNLTTFASSPGSLRGMRGKPGYDPARESN